MTANADTLPMVVAADDAHGARQGCWTYDAYAAMPDDGRRYEIVEGVLYMTPAPGIEHQASALRFGSNLYVNVELAGLGRVFPAPCDVELSPGTVVQPDVIVILKANLGIITPTRIVGAPDLVIEIASPGTVGYDRRVKQDAYARAGVREYWLADPYARTIEVLMLENGAYRSVGVFTGAVTLPSRVLPDLPVLVEQFFA